MRGGCAKIVMKLSSWPRTRELRAVIFLRSPSAGSGSPVLSHEQLVTGDFLSWGGSHFWAGSSPLGTTSVLNLTSLPLSPHHF